MESLYLVPAAIIVSVLLIIGVVYTLREFKKMDKNPGKFREDNDYPRIKWIKKK